MKYRCNNYLTIVLNATLIITGSCLTPDKIELVDKNASEATLMLYKKIRDSTRKGFLVGHQDDTAYGIGWKYKADSTTSDVEMVCGDYPALYGWEIGGIEKDNPSNLDTVYFDLIRKLVSDANRRGGIPTISWHANNPVTGEDAWSERETVKYILSDPEKKEAFIGWLDKVSAFLKSLKDDEGNAIPVIFRPWHEWNGDWFWWGTPHSTNEEYIELWRLTVETLRDKNKVHNVLFAFSSNTFTSKDEFLGKYPGKDYVDILGFDIYMNMDDTAGFRNLLRKDLVMLSEIAGEQGKLYAVTEAGYEGIPSDNWFSEVLYPEIKDSGISWILFWRNATTTHHFAPYPGHQSAGDFKKFYSFPETIFERDLQKITGKN